MPETNIRSASATFGRVLGLLDGLTPGGERGGVSLRWWSSVARGYAYWLVSGLILFVWGYLLSMSHGFGLADESWFLQVVHRVTSGEVLYRDIFFGATPLSVYITATLTTVLGTEILVVKAVVVFCFVLTVLLSCRIARQLDSAQGVPFLLVIALFVYALPKASAAYSPLANVFLLSCFSAALFWRESQRAESSVGDGWLRSVWALAMAGGAAGLCFASKQNIGLYALAALVLTVVISAKDKRWSRQKRIVSLLVVLSGFLLVAALVLLPVWFSGGAEKLLEYGFFKINYLRFGQVSYLDGFGRLATLVGTAGSVKSLTQIYFQVLFLLPPLMFIALLVAWLRANPDERGWATTVVLFIGAAFLGVFPRADMDHLRSAIPELLLGLVYAWHRIKPSLAARWVRLAQAGVLLWLGVGLGFTLLSPVVKLASGNYQLSTLPHFRGVLMQVAQHTELRTYAKTLAEVMAGDQPLLLSPHAGFYYLSTGLKNPTPFDYPLVTAFGRQGEAEVMAAISRHEIQTVCLDSQYSQQLSGLRPVRLERYVREHMERSGEVGFCTLYRVRP